MATPAGRLAPALLNVLRPGLKLRIRIHLGDLDKVFDPINTVLGKKQRLQALGFYYEVITGPAAGNNVTEAYTNCLAAWSKARAAATGSPFANAAAAERDMQAQIRKFVVENGALPAPGGNVRVQLPGTFTFNNTSDLSNGGVADGSPLPSIRFNDEGTLWTNNTALGKIPIIALVEEQTRGSWAPSPNRTVHFQLIPPYYDNAAAELALENGFRTNYIQSVNAAGAVNIAGGPKPFLVGAPPPVAGAYAVNFNAADPQRFNCHSSRGGKRGLAAAGWVLTSLPAAQFPGFNVSQVSTQPNAAKALTNAKGEAGIMLLPSRMGGDFYRLRIFVDPIGAVASNGTGAGAVVKETGRFEVTKHIMWSRHILKPMPVLPAANTVRGVQARLSILGYDTGAIDGVNGGWTQGALTAFQGNNAPPLPINGNVNDGPTQAALDTAYKAYLTNCGQALGNINFATIKAQFDQMHCAFNSAGARATPKLTESEYKAAIRWARAQAQANQAGLGLSQNYDINAMVEDTFQTPFWIVIRHPLFYNRTRGAGVPAAGPAPPVAAPRTPYDTYYIDAAKLMYGNAPALGLLEWLLRYFNGNASVKNPPTANVTRYSTPGLSVIRCFVQAVTMVNPGQPGQIQVPQTTAASGIAMKERGCYVFYGNTTYNNWPYQGDGLSKNTRHEMGHTLYLRHSKMPPPAGANHAGGDFHEDHDNNDCCVMSYFYNIGEYCAKCQLKIRGWDISKMPV